MMIVGVIGCQPIFENKERKLPNRPAVNRHARIAREIRAHELPHPLTD